jgi:hypothetical protein
MSVEGLLPGPYARTRAPASALLPDTPVPRERERMLRSSLVGRSLLALLGAMMMTGTAQAQRRDSNAVVAARNGWLTNLKTAKEQAKKTGKPMLVVLRCFP